MRERDALHGVAGRGVQGPGEGCCVRGFGRSRVLLLTLATPTCNTCTPAPPPATAEPPSCEQTGTLDWRQWYPLDYGQRPGFRALNWWSDPQYCAFRGVSLYNQPGAPGGFPLTRTVGGETECVDYYWLWTCGDPTCSWRRPQLLSIGRDGRDLLLWGNTEPRGGKDMFQVLLDTSQMECVPCQANAIRNFFASHPGSQPTDFMMPMRYRLPGQTGVGASESTNGGCMVMFEPAVVDEDGSVTLDPCKIVGDFTVDGTLVREQTGHEFVMTTNLGYLNDPGSACNIIEAVNWSLTDNVAACEDVDRQCRAHAPGVSPDSDTVRTRMRAQPGRGGARALLLRGQDRGAVGDVPRKPGRRSDAGAGAAVAGGHRDVCPGGSAAAHAGSVLRHQLVEHPRPVALREPKLRHGTGAHRDPG